MQVLVPNLEETEVHKRRGETASPCLPSPLLEDPISLPRYILFHTDDLSEKAQKVIRNEMWENPAYDEELTALLKARTEGIFDAKVAYAELDNGDNVPTICQFNGQAMFAVGARIELLHNRYDIGPLLLTLLSESPLWIMTPSEIKDIVDWEMDAFHPRQTNVDLDNAPHVTVYQGGKYYPDWVEQRSSDVPKGLPYNLNKLIEECVENTGRKFEPVWDETNGLGNWPIATCSWYGFDPFKSKVAWKILQDQQYRTGVSPQDRYDGFNTWKDQGQGTDPTWIALDKMIQDLQEYSYTTCATVHHELTEFEHDLTMFGPFAKLLKYLSHARH